MFILWIWENKLFLSPSPRPVIYEAAVRIVSVSVVGDIAVDTK